MYQCINSSKCISKHRVCDSMKNCDYGDDEKCDGISESCLGYGSNKPFKCTIANICISQYLVGNRLCNCPMDQYNLCDDESPDKHYIRKHIYFPTICDGFTELIPVLIDGRNETDKTECEYWQCNNTYTRCDGIWNCFNGADEIDCNPFPRLNSPYHHHHHICVSPKTNQFMCLSINKVNDGKIDCLGAFDEPKLCRKNNYGLNDEKFHCSNHINDSCVSLSKLCIESKCENNTDKQLCDSNRNETDIDSFCDQKYESIRSDVENFLCNHLDDTNKPEILHFSLNEKTNFSKTKTQQSTNIIMTHSSILSTTRQYQNQRVSFNGERCEIFDTIITVLFDKDIVLPQSIFFHFIRQIDHTAPENGSTFKSVITNQRSATILNGHAPFHVIFVELPDKTFHLITIQTIYNQSTTIDQIINLLNRCKHIRELFNETIIKYHLLRRIKYDHLPCQTYSPQLTCFYDDIHFYLCTNFDRQRIANCFDKAICSQTSICVCRTCFHGVRCHFSSHLFGLSLDAVLGYHIQSSTLQISVILTIILILVGLVNGVLCILTFKNKEGNEMGSDLYLLGLSMDFIINAIIPILVGGSTIFLVIHQNRLIQNNYEQDQVIATEQHEQDLYIQQSIRNEDLIIRQLQRQQDLDLAQLRRELDLAIIENQSRTSRDLSQQYYNLLELYRAEDSKISRINRVEDQIREKERLLEMTLIEYHNDLLEILLNYGYFRVTQDKTILLEIQMKTRSILRKLDPSRRTIVFKSIMAIGLNDHDLLEDKIDILSSTDLRGVTFSDLVLHEFSIPQHRIAQFYVPQSDLRNASFQFLIFAGTSVDLSRTNMYGTNWNNAILAFFSIENALMNAANFHHSSVTAMQFRFTQLNYASFNLLEKCHQLHFESLQMNHVDLSENNFNELWILHVTMIDSSLNHTRHMKSHFEDVNMTRTDFSNSIFIGVIFKKVIMTQCQMENTKFISCIFTRSILVGCLGFNQANWHDTQLTNTQLPNGTHILRTCLNCIQTF
ncbi:hypothetical protein I4U23_027541 [Adineta vaga]|nr:hypothetical protein I4U23_027541 [Adineta vaga]